MPDLKKSNYQYMFSLFMEEVVLLICNVVYLIIIAENSVMLLRAAFVNRRSYLKNLVLTVKI
jgi:cytochrome c oxidase assembly factor CtaG